MRCRRRPKHANYRKSEIWSKHGRHRSVLPDLLRMERERIKRPKCLMFATFDELKQWASNRRRSGPEVLEG
jgi:hypothetical protein